MFYSIQILTRGGPLQIIWLAAHLDSKLKRQQIDAASIPSSVDSIIHPQIGSSSQADYSDAPLALRLSGQLLLGVVRVYSRKVAYLQQDCENALLNIRTAAHRDAAHHEATAVGRRSTANTGGRSSAGAAAVAALQAKPSAITMRDPSFAVDALDEALTAGERDQLSSLPSQSVDVQGLAQGLAGTLHRSGLPARPSASSNSGLAYFDGTDEMFDVLPAGVNGDMFEHDLDDQELERLRVADALELSAPPLPRVDAAADAATFYALPPPRQAHPGQVGDAFELPVDDEAVEAAGGCGGLAGSRPSSTHTPAPGSHSTVPYTAEQAPHTVVQPPGGRGEPLSISRDAGSREQGKSLEPPSVKRMMRQAAVDKQWQRGAGEEGLVEDAEGLAPAPATVSKAPLTLPAAARRRRARATDASLAAEQALLEDGPLARQTGMPPLLDEAAITIASAAIRSLLQDRTPLLNPRRLASPLRRQCTNGSGRSLLAQHKDGAALRRVDGASLPDAGSLTRATHARVGAGQEDAVWMQTRALLGSELAEELQRLYQFALSGSGDGAGAATKVSQFIRVAGETLVAPGKADGGAFTAGTDKATVACDVEQVGGYELDQDGFVSPATSGHDLEGDGADVCAGIVCDDLNNGYHARTREGDGQEEALDLTVAGRLGKRRPSRGGPTGFGDERLAQGGGDGAASSWHGAGDDIVKGGEPAQAVGDGFTARTQKVLQQLQRLLLPGQPAASASKRRRGGEAATAAPQTAAQGASLTQLLPLDGPRVSSARLFYDLLVLQNRGYVQLEQSAPFAEIHVLACPKLAEAH